MKFAAYITFAFCVFPFPTVAANDETVAIRAFAALNGGTIRPETSVACPGCHFSPVREGMVDGYRVVAILIDSGTNGGADRVHLFVHGIDGNGSATADLGTIPAYQGDRMNVLFTKGKMYLVNEIYLPGEAHCCPSQIVVTKWGIANDKLLYFGLKTLPIKDQDDYFVMSQASYALYDANWLLRGAGHR